MRHVKPISPRLRLLGAALVLALAAAAAGGGAARAVDGCKGTCSATTYYSDSFHRQAVGSFVADACGNCTGSGQITSYYTVRPLVCTGAC